MTEPIIFEKSVPGRRAGSVPGPDVPVEPVESLLPGVALRSELRLPEVGELELVRHYTRLSQLNYCIDTTFYPLGSCTMKYNPVVNEVTAALPGFAHLHPYQPEESAQGALQLMHELQAYLGEVSGLPAVCLQPAAGAHGELTGMLLIRAYHEKRGDSARKRVLIPDSAHGTNPATARMVGYRVQTIRSDARGNLDVEALKNALGPDVAALMITIPSTLGLFDEHVEEVIDLVHRSGAQVYCDGANLNAVLGQARLGDLGVDVLHFNLHKTFTTPHGGGGPPAGPIGVREHLAPFLPVPVVARRENGEVYLDYDRPDSIGKVKAFYGNFAMLVRAYTYIRSIGDSGIREVGRNAVLNANYLLARLRGTYQVRYDRLCKHEFVLTARSQARAGARALDIAKRLIDYGYHPPTIYFPLIVEEALMIEPTETESVQTLDAFADALIQIAAEISSDVEVVKSAPHHTPVGRLDEVRAVRQPDLRWRDSARSVEATR